MPDGQFHYPSLDGKLCGADEYTLTKSGAELLLVLDRSGSMAARVGGSTTTKWEDASAAARAVVMNNSSGLSWGLKLFPSGSQRCAVSSGVEVPVGASTAAAIGTAIGAAGPPMGRLGEGTPTTETIKAAAAHLRSLTSPAPKYIVLATDGAPTCANNNPNGRDDQRTITAIQEATAAGFKTFVIGIASAASEIDTLNKMAEAGATARAGATRYYPASSRAELAAALDAITSAVTTCVFPLANRPPDVNFVTVTVGGMFLIRDLQHMQGWDYVNNGAAVQIYGSACDALKKGTSQSAGIFYGCPN